MPPLGCTNASLLPAYRAPWAAHSVNKPIQRGLKGSPSTCSLDQWLGNTLSGLVVKTLHFQYRGCGFNP